jgi:hypothetical protein
MQPTRPLLASVALAAALLAAAATHAQAPQAEPPQAQSPSPVPQSTDIPDQKLDAAAAAVERVAGLRRDYQGRIAAAAPSDKERLADEAINEMSKAVTEQGLSVEEYTSILEVAQNDPTVRDKIRQRLPSKK